jgi:hypothetical protein
VEFMGTTGIGGYSDMSAYEVKSRISVSLLDKVMTQAETHAAGILDMLPPAGVNEVGGLLDKRA